MKPPHNVAFLERAIRKIVDTNENGIRLRTMMANVIVGQFLDGAVMRGGGSLKLRYGGAFTRYTMDFDAARNVDEAEFVARFNRRLAVGWSGFSGRLVKMPKAHPKNVPEAYVMQPFEVKLTYRNHAWCTVTLEVSYNEVGDADDCDMIPLNDELKGVFTSLGLREPNPVPLMRMSHQIAQKLHGATDTRSVRAQDLIDLQLILAKSAIDLAKTNAVCQRLFAFRRMQTWPPIVVKGRDWDSIYNEEKDNAQGDPHPHHLAVFDLYLRHGCACDHQ